MIVNNQPRILYARTILKDIALPRYYNEARLSIPERFTAAVTRLYEARDWKTVMRTMSTRPIQDMIKSMKDFDADKIMPMSDESEIGKTDGTEYEKSDELLFDPATDRYSEFEFYRRHFDGPKPVDSTYILTYITTCFRSYEYVNTNEYGYTHGTQQSIIDSDGDVWVEADFLSMPECHLISQADIDSYTSELAYRLRRLFDLGNTLGVSILSLLVAHEKACHTRLNQIAKASAQGVTKNYSVTMNKCINEGVYSCDSYGVLDEEPFTIKQKSKKLELVFDIMQGSVPKYASYTQDMLMVKHLVDKLNIDLCNVDVSKFDYSFYASLQSEYLVSDKDYFKLLEVIQTKNTSSAYKEAYNATMQNVQLALEESPYIADFNRQNYNKEKRTARRETVLYKFGQFIQRFNLIENFKEEDLYFEHEILHMNNHAFVFDAGGTRQNTTYGSTRCILCANGLVFAITITGLWCMSLELFYSLYAKIYNKERLTNSEVESWEQIA